MATSLVELIDDAKPAIGAAQEADAATLIIDGRRVTLAWLEPRRLWLPPTPELAPDGGGADLGLFEVLGGLTDAFLEGVQDVAVLGLLRFHGAKQDEYWPFNMYIGLIKACSLLGLLSVISGCLRLSPQLGCIIQCEDSVTSAIFMLPALTGSCTEGRWKTNQYLCNSACY